jgi:hypothetical protein
MARFKRREPTEAEIAQVESEIVRIRSLGIRELRAEWEGLFEREAPKALTKDLLARMICFRIQEAVYGGFDRATLKLLDSYGASLPTSATRDWARRHRRLKPGTELVREYKAERHTVVVMEEGFAWRGKTYSSLTTIARQITGTAWNGPRFFGLREKGEGGAAGARRPNGKDHEAQPDQVAR